MKRMYLELEQETIKKINELLLTDLGEKGNFIPVENIKQLIEELLMVIDELEEKNKDIISDRDTNYFFKNFQREYGE